MVNVLTQEISIRPESSVYATYKRISYKPWYALAEFVDNSTQNFMDHESEIAKVEGKPATLDIHITYSAEDDILYISDNANGMNMSELTRAVQLNHPPANTSGRSEFGMGLKMAAIWMGETWRVVTKRLHATEEYSVEVDVKVLQAASPETLQVDVREGCDPALHYTRVEIEGLHRKFRGRTIGRIKEHLASMYRRDLVSGRIKIFWNTEPLEWKPGQPFVEEMPDGSVREWKKPIDIEVAGLPVKGSVWIQIPGSAKDAGFHLLRRGRLVLGGPGEGYKPEEIFGAPNSFMSQRLFGELDMDQWPVSQSKDAFDWSGDLENELIIKLRENLAEYIQHTKNIQSPTGGTRPTKADGQVAGDSTRFDLSDSSIDEALLIVEEGPVPESKPDDEEVLEMERLTASAGEPTYVSVGSESMPTLKVWWLDDQPESALYSEFACPKDDEIQLSVNLNHPFVTNVLQRDPDKLSLFADLLYVDALTERGARKRGGNIPPSAFRFFKDQFLRRVKANIPKN